MRRLGRDQSPLPGFPWAGLVLAFPRPLPTATPGARAISAHTSLSLICCSPALLLGPRLWLFGEQKEREAVGLEGVHGLFPDEAPVSPDPAASLLHGVASSCWLSGSGEGVAAEGP